jgi:uncharacterized protein (DUF1778 family)
LKTERVEIRVTPEVKAQIQGMAASKGCTLSQYILALVELDLQKVKHLDTEKLIDLDTQDIVLTLAVLGRAAKEAMLDGDTEKHDRLKTIMARMNVDSLLRDNFGSNDIRDFIV